MSRKKETANLVKEFTQGLAGTVLDTTLFLVCFSTGWVLSSMGSYKGRVNLAPLSYMMGVYPELKSKLRNTFHLAKRDGYISKSSNSLTELGVNRLMGVLPHIKRHSVWSGSFWLVTYDIVENRKFSRDKLREFLLSQGYGQLQKSVYLAPFDPTDLVREAASDMGPGAEVIISRMGKDGHIGSMTTQALINKVYKLKPIEIKYRRYLDQMSNDEFNSEEIALLFLQYLSILKRDPQLPMELLPSDWPGETVYRLVKKRFLPILSSNNVSAEKILGNLNFSLEPEVSTLSSKSLTRGEDYWTGE